MHHLADTEATQRVGRLLATLLQEGDVIALLGDLGAGKTSLVKAAIASLCDVDEDDVVSPTFVLVREYEGELPVLHMDAYRLSGPSGLESLDLALGSGPVAFVEWAERVDEALPDERLVLELEHQDGGRRLSVSGCGERGEVLAAELEKLLSQGKS
ncbi:MAG: tRNA (adenosine(37)-N6)-threonylcarbamoyltransferase complex ATPase subunit type 1 TsaE [Planctomycetes bacterium]|nr:tRNA (adenosine(37)-N6)-threonylcarbamoyltransferase complex ATPase subunit type 1 TsaE [Planctomycetota bacterium]